MWRIKVVIHGTEGSVTGTVANEVLEEMSNAGTRRILRDQCCKSKKKGVERSPLLFELKNCKVTCILPCHPEEWEPDFSVVTIQTDYNAEEAELLLSEAITVFERVTEATARSLRRRLE
jgi:hypothetical protein